jgi:hypothetical protein
MEIRSARNLLLRAETVLMYGKHQVRHAPLP